MLGKNELLHRCCELYRKAWIPTESNCDRLIFPLHPALDRDYVIQRIHQADQEVEKLLDDNGFKNWPEDE